MSKKSKRKPYSMIVLVTLGVFIGNLSVKRSTIDFLRYVIIILKCCIEIIREAFNLFLQRIHSDAKRSNNYLTIAILLVSSFMPCSFAQIQEQKTDRFYVKGIANKNGPFAGQYVRILGNQKNVIIIRNAQDRMIVVKVTVSLSSFCNNMAHSNCINALVSDVKNTDSPVLET